MVFEVALKLRENDEDSRRIMHVLASCTMLDGVRTLGGGGGCVRSRATASLWVHREGLQGSGRNGVRPQVDPKGEVKSPKRARSRSA